MIERLALIFALSLIACTREAPRGAPTEAAEPPTAEPAENPPPERGPALLWIFPKLSATLKGEQAEPYSQPAVLSLDDGSVVRLAVRMREGEVLHLPDGAGRKHNIELELVELGSEEEAHPLHRFTLWLAEGPDAEPTDDMLRASVEGGSRIVVSLGRRHLREHAEELEADPEIIERVILARDERGTLRRTPIE